MATDEVIGLTSVALPLVQEADHAQLFFIGRLRLIVTPLASPLSVLVR